MLRRFGLLVFGLVVRLMSRVTFNVDFSDRYLSLPLPGRKRNQLALTTGFGLDFR